MFEPCYISSFLCGTLATTGISNQEYVRNYCKVAVKRHHQIFPRTTRTEVVAAINLSKLKVLRFNGKIWNQISSGSFVWLVSKEEWDLFVNYLNSQPDRPTRHGKKFTYHSPSSLSPKELKDFVMTFCECNKFSLEKNAVMDVPYSNEIRVASPALLKKLTKDSVESPRDPIFSLNLASLTPPRSEWGSREIDEIGEYDQRGSLEIPKLVDDDDDISGCLSPEPHLELGDDDYHSEDTPRKENLGEMTESDVETVDSKSNGLMESILEEEDDQHQSLDCELLGSDRADAEPVTLEKTQTDPIMKSFPDLKEILSTAEKLIELLPPQPEHTSEISPSNTPPKHRQKEALKKLLFLKKELKAIREEQGELKTYLGQLTDMTHTFDTLKMMTTQGSPLSVKSELSTSKFKKPSEETKMVEKLPSNDIVSAQIPIDLPEKCSGDISYSHSSIFEPLSTDCSNALRPQMPLSPSRDPDSIAASLKEDNVQEDEELANDDEADGYSEDRIDEDETEEDDEEGSDDADIEDEDYDDDEEEDIEDEDDEEEEYNDGGEENEEEESFGDSDDTNDDDSEVNSTTSRDMVLPHRDESVDTSTGITHSRLTAPFSRFDFLQLTVTEDAFTDIWNDVPDQSNDHREPMTQIHSLDLHAEVEQDVNENQSIDSDSNPEETIDSIQNNSLLVLQGNKKTTIIPMRPLGESPSMRVESPECSQSPQRSKDILRARSMSSPSQHHDAEREISVSWCRPSFDCGDSADGVNDFIPSDVSGIHNELDVSSGSLHTNDLPSYDHDNPLVQEEEEKVFQQEELLIPEQTLPIYSSPLIDYFEPFLRIAEPQKYEYYRHHLEPKSRHEYNKLCILWTIFQIYTRSDGPISSSIKMTQILYIFRDAGLISLTNYKKKLHNTQPIPSSDLSVVYEAAIEKCPLLMSYDQYHQFLDQLTREHDEIIPKLASMVMPDHEKYSTYWHHMLPDHDSLTSKLCPISPLQEESVIANCPFSPSFTHSTNNIRALRGVALLWEKNIEQMRQLYHYYSLSSAQQRLVKKINLFVTFESYRELLQDFDLFPSIIDQKWLVNVYRATKLWEWRMLQSLTTTSSPESGTQQIKPTHQYDVDRAMQTLEVTFRGFLEALTRIALVIQHKQLIQQSSLSLSSSSSSLSHLTSNGQDQQKTLMDAVVLLLRLMDTSNGKKKLSKSHRRSVFIRQFVYK